MEENIPQLNLDLETTCFFLGGGGFLFDFWVKKTHQFFTGTNNPMLTMQCNMLKLKENKQRGRVQCHSEPVTKMSY